MKLTSPLPRRKARIEIIPLIDIMFFLLASFMLVSLSMIRLNGFKMTLPAASSATPETKPDFIAISINPGGDIFFQEEPGAITPANLTERLKPLQAKDPNVRIYINADRDATHGSVVDVLDRVRAAGIQKVSYAIDPRATNAKPPAPGAGTAPKSPVAPASAVPPVPVPASQPPSP